MSSPDKECLGYYFFSVIVNFTVFLAFRDHLICLHLLAIQSPFRTGRGRAMACVWAENPNITLICASRNKITRTATRKLFLRYYMQRSGNFFLLLVHVFGSADKGTVTLTHWAADGCGHGRDGAIAYVQLASLASLSCVAWRLDTCTTQCTCIIATFAGQHACKYCLRVLHVYA